MPHGIFTTITEADDGKLLVVGKADEQDDHDDPNHPAPSAIQIAIVALHDRHKRIDCAARTTGKDWDARPRADDTNGHGAFKKGDHVILLGAATHSDHSTGFPSPYVWHGFFEIQPKNSRGRGEVKVKVVGPA